ncbi:MAG: LuxR C-terminal-related transcriptional regulator [Candidatus Entotheonellia bacterium]
MAASQGTLSQDALHTILTQLPFGLMVLDLKGTVLTSNPAAQMILKNHFGWRGSEAHGSRSLPREILAGIEYLCEASRRRVGRSVRSSLTLASSDLYLHLWLLSLKEEPKLRGAKHLYVVVVLKNGELSLTAPWQSQARLTPREAEVLQWLAQGKTRKEISVILEVGEATVRTHLEHLYAKLGVANRVEAASVALWQQLAESLTSTLPPF